MALLGHAHLPFHKHKNENEIEVKLFAKKDTFTCSVNKLMTRTTFIPTGFYQQNLGQRFGTSKMHLSPPVA